MEEGEYAVANTCLCDRICGGCRVTVSLPRLEKWSARQGEPTKMRRRADRHRLLWTRNRRRAMAIGVSVLSVITQDGNVFGADVEGQDLRPVFQFSGARRGFNRQGRLMVAMSVALKKNKVPAVVTYI